jgi:hypothetical protein
MVIIQLLIWLNRCYNHGSVGIISLHFEYISPN